MPIQLKIYAGEADDFDALREWMTGLPGPVAVEAVPRATGLNAQGSVWDFLSVACGTGGAVTAVVQALKVWIESRVTSVRIVVGDDEFVVTTRNASETLPAAAQALHALETVRRDAPS